MASNVPMAMGDILERIRDEIGPELFDMQSGATWLQAAEAITGRRFKANMLPDDPRIAELETRLRQTQHLLQLERARHAFIIQYGQDVDPPAWGV